MKKIDGFLDTQDILSRVGFAVEFFLNGLRLGRTDIKGPHTQVVSCTNVKHKLQWGMSNFSPLSKIDLNGVVGVFVRIRL